ncbi:MAG: hypothetical protein ABW034_14700, partial [Steroidobacteraceae bacterium]
MPSPRFSHATVFDDQSYICTYFDVEQTRQSIATFSQADAHRQLVKDMQGMGEIFFSGMFRPP